MGAETREGCDRIIASAEARGRCAVPMTPQEGRRLRYLAGKDELVRPYPGAFARRGRWEGLSRHQQLRHVMRTLSDQGTKWVFCAMSAAVAYGLEVPNEVLGRLDAVAHDGSSAHGSRFVMRHVVGGGNGIIVDGMRVTPFDQTVHDCLRMLPFDAALAVADSALRRTGRSRAWLCDLFANDSHGVSGVRRARCVCRFADPRAENGGESMARAAIIEEGFELPDLQVELHDPMDGAAYRVDFLWTCPDGRRIIGELDGWEKYLDPAMTEGRGTLGVLVAERQRESRITMSGASVVRFSYRQVRDHGYLARLLAAYGVPRALERTEVGRRPMSRAPRRGRWRIEAHGWTVFVTRRTMHRRPKRGGTSYGPHSLGLDDKTRPSMVGDFVIGA